MVILDELRDDPCDDIRCCASWVSIQDDNINLFWTSWSWKLVHKFFSQIRTRAANAAAARVHNHVFTAAVLAILEVFLLNGNHRYRHMKRVIDAD